MWGIPAGSQMLEWSALRPSLRCCSCCGRGPWVFVHISTISVRVLVLVDVRVVVLLGVRVVVAMGVHVVVIAVVLSVSVHVQWQMAVRVQVVVKVHVLVSAGAGGSKVELVDLCVELCLYVGFERNPRVGEDCVQIHRVGRVAGRSSSAAVRREAGELWVVKE